MNSLPGVTATADSAVLPGVLGSSFGLAPRDKLGTSGTGRTGSPSDLPFRYASGPIPRYRGTVTRWHARLRDLATAIHETSGLGQHFSDANAEAHHARTSKSHSLRVLPPMRTFERDDP
jgi:hypothetical protein